MADTEPGARWQELVDLDRRHVWHPYAPVPPAMAPFPVESASGVRIRLVDGRELVDGMSSWWAAIWGYRHPVIDAAVRDQLDVMPHVMFGGLTHEPAVRLAERLAAMTPAPLDRVFYADSGSVAVEVAIKMCLQYWRSRGEPDKTRLLALRGGYHGDTFAAMSVCDPVGGMHHLFTGTLAEQVFAEKPPAGFAAPLDPVYEAQMVDLVKRHADELAAVIVEPVVQGAGGMHFYAPGYLADLRALCDTYEILLVFDEIATGFGRTGRLFAAEHAGVTPDVLCLGKALTGGCLSLAATLCTPDVADTISEKGESALMHGPTFMANPLACSAALASTGLLESGSWAHDVARIEGLLAEHLAPAAGLPGVADVRVLGAIGVVQLDHPVDVPAATAAAMDEGVWLRPFRDLIYTMPPYISGDEDVVRIARAVLAAAQIS